LTPAHLRRTLRKRDAGDGRFDFSRNEQLPFKFSTAEESRMRKLLIAGVTGTVALLGVWVGVARAQGAQGGAAQSVLPAPTDKAMYIANSEIQSTWKDLEARQGSTGG
jgi:hypothetical protein